VLAAASHEQRRGEGKGGGGSFLRFGRTNAVAFFDPADPPDDNHLLRGLSVPPLAAIKLDTSYLDFIFRVDLVFSAYRAAGWDTLVKPWFDVWLPDATVEQYIGEVIPTLSPLDVGPTGFVLLFPKRRPKVGSRGRRGCSLSR
jgi:cytokinin dehydrogenase